MGRRIAGNPLRAPLTSADLIERETGVRPAPKPARGMPIACAKCELSGGTMVKQDDAYVHQNKELCNLLAGRR